MFDRKATTARRLYHARLASRGVALGCTLVAIQLIAFRGIGLPVTIGLIALSMGAVTVHLVVRSINRGGDPRHRRLPHDPPEEIDPFKVE